MKTNLPKRDAGFTVEDGCLVRTASGGDPASGGGRACTHRCPRKTFEIVAHAIAQTGIDGRGTAAGEIARKQRLPFTQVDVAMAFLKHLGILEVRHRRSYPATRDIYLDAMIEYCALAEAPPAGEARCERCGAKGVPLIMSRFNTQMICVSRPDGQPACEAQEKAHPGYPAAAQAELDALRRGDTQFPGLGKPDDL